MKKNGFTLIELLVAIAVFGLIASLMLLTLNSVRDKEAKLKEDPKSYCKEKGLTMQLNELPATCQQYFK